MFRRNLYDVLIPTRLSKLFWPSAAGGSRGLVGSDTLVDGVGGQPVLLSLSACSTRDTRFTRSYWRWQGTGLGQRARYRRPHLTGGA